jgi:hypothetical protein
MEKEDANGRVDAAMSLSCPTLQTCQQNQMSPLQAFVYSQMCSRLFTNRLQVFTGGQVLRFARCPSREGVEGAQDSCMFGVSCLGVYDPKRGNNVLNYHFIDFLN